MRVTPGCDFWENFEPKGASLKIYIRPQFILLDTNCWLKLFVLIGKHGCFQKLKFSLSVRNESTFPNEPPTS